MAALIKHVLSKSHHNVIQFSGSIPALQKQTRFYTKRHFKQKLNKVQVPACRTLKATEDSVATKGFLRCQKDYKPPQDLHPRLDAILERVVGPSSDLSKASKIEESIRFPLFKKCFDNFSHGIPNSILHTIRTYEDLYTYYSSPVDATLPLDKMKRKDLPENLYIQYDYLRFNPDEDEMFKGQTAFPNSNTLVTGLRTRKKYKGHVVTPNWPDSNL